MAYNATLSESEEEETLDKDQKFLAFIAPHEESEGLVSGLSSVRWTSRSALSMLSHIMMMMIECCDHSYFIVVLQTFVYLGYF